MRHNASERARATMTRIGSALFALVFAGTALVAPTPALAQGMATVEGTGPLLTAIVGEQVDKKVTDVLLESTTIAVVNAVNYFASQIAYSAAVALTSDCPGQGACWDSKAFSQGFREAWQGAIGEAVGSISEGLLGNDFLCSPNPLFTLTIQLGLMDELKPKAPRCDYNAFVSGWKTLINSVESGEILKQALPTFQPGSSPIAMSLDVMDGVVTAQADTDRNYMMKKLMDASAGGGFSDIRDPVSGRVKSPQVVVEEEFKTMRDQRDKAPTERGDAVTAGSIAGRAFGSIFVNMTQTFTQTLVARLWNKLVNGLLSTEELLALQPDLILDPEAVLVPGKSGVQQALQQRFLFSTSRDAGIIDPLLEYTACPGSNPGPNNCVIDSQFANAVRLGDTLPLTVKDAMDKGMLHKDWPLVPASAREKDRDPYCYTYGYCESNLKKLRAARIIPIGWEIAAAKSPPTGFATLGQVVAGFDDCNDEGVADSRHPWCHLIDPNWVLKVPPTMCRATVNGPALLSSEASSRIETCADSPTCLRQDDYGACTGGWGYCLQERNVWRFQGDQCPAYYNSCRTLVARKGGTVSYLMNTVQPGVCNAGNVGCTDYALERDFEQDDDDQSDDWDTSPARYLNREAKTCNPNDNGCTAVIPLAPRQSLNLVRNGSFEELADGDGNGSPEHPAHWTPYGSVASGAGSIRNDGSKSVDGINAMRVRRATTSVLDDEVEGLCQLSGGDDCDEADGCTCSREADDRVMTCGVPFGRDECSLTDLVSQSGITVRRRATYSLSVTYIPTGNSDAVGGNAIVRLFDESRDSVSASDVTATATAYSGGVLNIIDRIGQPRRNDISCTGTSNGVLLTFNGTKDDDAKGMRVSCTFTVDRSIATAELDFYGTASNEAFIDAVQFEEGPPTPFHDDYGEASAIEYRKIAPDYLKCTGEDSDRAECANFSQLCRENEVGCSSYTPSNGDPVVPAVVAPQDYCPAECAGYDIYKQEPTAFDHEKFPVYLIPSTALQCTAAESGCSEFTDLTTEEKSYFSELRLCERPSTDPETVFYSWEGSDTAGFQLRNWNLKKTSAEVLRTTSDLGATAGAGTVGHAPCTKLGTDGVTCTSRDSGSGTSTYGLCTRADIDAGNYDCREFYDADGNRHYRQMSKTIILSSSCREYRITTSTQSDCEGSNGRWDTGRQQCVYSADAPESSACSAAANGCRPYSGNTAGNIRTQLNEDFESGKDGWKGDGEISEESVVAGGKSYRLDSGDAARYELALNGTSGKTFTLTFWARGAGTLAPSLVDGGSGLFGAVLAATSSSACTALGGQWITDASLCVDPTLTLTGSWREYAFGPAYAVGNLGANPELRFDKAGSNFAFIDNVILKEAQDSIYVVRDSWRTPLSCDTSVAGTPSPQEMLGCKEYSDKDGRLVYLRSFDTICREKAIGCMAYSDTRNTVQNPYAESFNAVCRLSSACDAGDATAGSCRCDYKEFHNALGGTGKDPWRYLSDVCRVAIGQRDCRFQLDRVDDLTAASSYPDRVNIESDKRVYLVPSDAFRCPAASLGCREVGVREYTHEKECVNRNSDGSARTCGTTAGCDCTVDGVSCTIERGQQTCTAVFETAQISSWESPTILDNPATYATALCTRAAVMCEEFKGTDGTYYFKHPQSSTCEFKEDVSVDGQKRSGWFRASETGLVEPCSPELLKNGEFYDIAKNADAACALDSVCTRTEGCWCPSSSTQTCLVAQGRERCGYQGWVGACSAEFDRCEEFVDPIKTSPANPLGTPYYYLMNSKLDLKSCSGSASLKEGCVLFQRTGDPSRRYDAEATYQRSENAAGGNAVTPIDCSTSPRPRECNNGSNDANMILKVRHDRECNQWLACSATDVVWDEALGQWKNVCTQLDACEKQRNVGDSQECSDWATVPIEKLTEEVYAQRDTSYGGFEYSGYSLPGKYPVQYVTLAVPDDQLSNKLYGVVIDPDDTCDDSADCSGGGVCDAGQCFYDLTGGELDKKESTDAAACRGYPEQDSPFGRSILEELADNVQNRQAAFRGANVCASGYEECDCSYARIGYGPNGALERFVPIYASDDVTKVCSGGPRDGMRCDNAGDDEKQAEFCNQELGGTCVSRTRIAQVVGWEGYCVDPDYSFNIGGDTTRYACNLWLPVDRLPGAPDLNHQETGAGFETSEDIAYCSIAEGRKDSLPSYLADIDSHVNSEEHYTIDSLPIYNAVRLHSTSTWAIQTDGGHHDLAVSPGVKKEEVSYLLVKLRTYSDSGDGSKYYPTFLLYPGNDWKANTMFCDSNGGSGGCSADGDRVPCTNIYAQHKDTDCGPGGDRVRIVIKAVWDGNTLEEIDVEGRNNDEGGDDDPLYDITPYAVMRESCTEVKTVTNISSSSQKSVGWTDRLWQAWSSRNEGYDFAHVFAYVGSEIDPPLYGRIPTSFSVESNRVEFNAGSASPTNWPLHVWTSEGGSAGGMRITCESDGTTKYDNACDCAQQDYGGADTCTITFDAGETASGIPFACKGDCRYSGSGGVPGLNDGWDDEGSDNDVASASAASHISELFVRIYNTYRWGSETNDGTTGVYDLISQPSVIRDFRYTNVAPSTAPQVRSVNTQACVGVEGNCPEGPEGITINNFMRGDLTGTGGKFIAVMKFYAWADPDHMPIRKRVVRYGDGPRTDSSLGNSSYYKNHRGCVTKSDGTGCDGSLQVCAEEEEDARDWGHTPQACETGYFTVNRTYICNAGVLSGLDDCGPAVGYPCKKSVVIANVGATDACVFRPSVRIVDNWGQCNGYCPGGLDGTDVCINNRADFTFDSGSGECKSMSSGAWTWYDGEITVAP